MEGQRLAGSAIRGRFWRDRTMAVSYQSKREKQEWLCMESVARGSVFGLGDILVLVRETQRNTFFTYYLYLLIMREADIPHVFTFSSWVQQSAR